MPGPRAATAAGAAYVEVPVSAAGGATASRPAHLLVDAGLAACVQVLAGAVVAVDPRYAARVSAAVGPRRDAVRPPSREDQP